MPRTAAPKTAAPNTTGSVNPAGRKTGQKLTSAQAADPVGDICLLPDLAGFTH
jgi:hypothetical protein